CPGRNCSIPMTSMPRRARCHRAWEPIPPRPTTTVSVSSVPLMVLSPWNLGPCSQREGFRGRMGSAPAADATAPGTTVLPIQHENEPGPEKPGVLGYRDTVGGRPQAVGASHPRGAQVHAEQSTGERAEPGTGDPAGDDRQDQGAAEGDFRERRALGELRRGDL